MQSTKENPLGYFESYIVGSGLKISLAEFIHDLVHVSGYHITDVDKTTGIVKYFDYNDSETFEVESKFEKQLTNDLLNELNNTKVLISDAVTEMVKANQDYINFLLLQQIQLQYIVNSGKENINSFPVLLKPLLGVANYINNKFLTESPKKIHLDLSCLKTDTDNAIIQDKNQIISSVLSYLKTQNEKDQKIMSDQEYELMIGYISFYVENNILPEDIQKLQTLNISKNLLRFTFWVLHKKLYTTSLIRPDFISLIKQIFSDFDEWELSTLKRKFGNKDKVTHNGKLFIPEIIKNELR
ncbi:hypothetical protein [Flavobacterium sp. LAR06]|uniref:hypothetical protein n=1 Tax=Flavobacterium sp. LAR06 TaxID=3064897 RepID=UPI0035BF7007